MKWKAIRIVVGLAGAVPPAAALAQPDCRATEFGWAHSVGAEHWDGATALAISQTGRIFLTGAYTDEVDFDPGKKTDKHHAKGEQDACLTSYGPGGDYGWTAAIGGSSFDLAYGVSVAPSGDVVMAGYFRDKVDFNPTREKDTQRAVGASDVSVTQLAADGSYGWTRAIGGQSSDVATAVTVDHQNDVILTGWFSETVDFDPGNGVDRHTAVAGTDVFVTKLTSNGKYRWTRTFGGDSINSDSGWAITTDVDDNIYVTGQFHGTADFDPGPGEDIHRSMGEEDAFITSFTADGDYRWTHTFGGPDRNDQGRGVVTDTAGNVYVAGIFVASVDFDRRGQGDVRVATGTGDMFVTSRASDGAYRWTRTIGGVDAVAGANAIAYDTNSGTLVVAGPFGGRVDFDPGDGVDERTARGSRDGFVTRLTTAGEYIRTDVFGGDDRDVPIAVAVDEWSSVVIAGEFESLNADFDPTTGADIHGSNGSADIFVAKFYCGPCESVERHTLTVSKKRALIGEVRALVPGGRVTVECTPSDPPGEPIEKNVNINGDNMGSYKLKNVKKGEYACAITEVRDADGNVVCDQPAGKRTVNVE